MCWKPVGNKSGQPCSRKFLGEHSATCGLKSTQTKTHTMDVIDLTGDDGDDVIDLTGPVVDPVVPGPKPGPAFIPVPVPDKGPAGDNCTVCWTNQPDGVVVPCAHDLCLQCARKILSSKSFPPQCPSCRGPIQGVLEKRWK